MTAVVRNRLIALGALLVAAGGLAFVAFGNIGENLVYYWSPAEMVAQGERAYGPTIRLGGVVQPGSIQWNEGKTELHFRVANDVKPESPSVLVKSSEVPPQMFREKIGVVVEGTYDSSKVFSSNRLMVNHSNEYRPPKEGESPDKWRETVATESTSFDEDALNGTLGYGLVLAGLGCAVFGALVGIVTGMKRSDAGLPWVRRAVWGFFLCMTGSNVTMLNALITHDFSVQYVAQVGSRATPLLYTLVSLWSALEGSILFWGFIMAAYILAFSLVHRREHTRYMSLALGSMLAVGVFFAFLIAGPANPWGSVSPVPADGPGPNPLLQNHILMVIHPPMLYLGYVGMTVPFGVAIAALLRGEIGEAWMLPLRRWTLVAWTFLSIGIILGAWWAYAVLGWGGYWAWDPVENASFLPWLTATAFIHSTMVQERKRTLKVWTLSLALASFVLTILGTFMTRSGIFNSVHSFTQSDIGPTFLVFIGILIFVSIGLMASRGHLLAPEGNITSMVSRETTILVNNLVFVAITFTVLLGTLYPLISEAVRGVRVSVGEPYFNKMAVPGGIAVLFLMGVGPMLPWGTSDPSTVRRQFIIPSAVGLAVAIACFAMGLRGVYPLLTFGLAGFVTVITFRELFAPVKVRMTERKENVFTALFTSAAKARRRFGGYVVHLGIVVIIVAVAASSSYVTHASGTLEVGETLDISGYKVKYLGLSSGEEPHRTFVAANLEVTPRGGGTPERFAPRMNYYERGADPVGTPAVRGTAMEDLYVSLLAFSEKGGTASFNAWVFPLVGWIWWSIPLLVLGSLISIWPARRSKFAVGAQGLERGAA